MSKKISIQLTDQQANTLLYAIQIYQDSYDGWDEADLKFFEVKKDLRAIAAVEQKILEASGANEGAAA
jgi:hypothetical protein